jgi:hypothetical protein
MPPWASVPAGAIATTCSRPAKGNFLGVDQRLAHGGEGLFLRVVFGDDEVGLLEIFGVDLGFVDELRDLHGVLGRHAEVGDFFGLEGDVVALGVFVALHDLRLCDNFRLPGGFIGCGVDGGGEDFLMLHALAAGAVDLMEADLALGFGGDEELDAEADQRDLNLSGPVGAGHAVSPHAKCAHVVRLFGGLVGMLLARSPSV